MEQMKTCQVCLQSKNTNEFNSNGKTPIGTKKIKPMCKPCELIGKKLASKTLLSSLVKMQCVKCGYDKCVSAIEFHHVSKDTKTFNVGQQRIANVEKLKKEITKCVILCSNCHREHHAGHFDVIDLPRAL